MKSVRYCTPEWLAVSASAYQENPRFKQELTKLSVKICYRIKAEPDWGIDKDILFGIVLEQGDLLQLSFFSEAEAVEKVDFILAATPQEWKKLLRKEAKFITDFMLSKVTLEQGSKVGIFNVAPHANTFIDALTQVELQFPDEMSPAELDEYRVHVAEFRTRLGV